MKDYYVEIWDKDVNVEITVQIFKSLNEAYAFLYRIHEIIKEYDLKYFVSDDLDSDRFYATKYKR